MFIFCVILELNEHELDASPLSGHKIRLVKHVINAYCKLRVHHMTKTFSKRQQLQQLQSVRKQLTKTIHFRNQ